jgi:hypothetical protein
MSILLTSCVSVELPGNKVTSAKGVEYQDPGGSYEEIKAKNADKTWLSKKSGNTISYLSECGNTADPSLQSIESDSLSALSNLEILKTETITFNGRGARQTVAAGTVDGVPVALSLLVFKKNGCNYTLSYGGLEKQFNGELPVFENFKKNFKAP